MAANVCPACAQQSSDPDFCSECGADMHAAPVAAVAVASAAPAATGRAARTVAVGSGRTPSGATHSSQILVDSARPGAALSVVQRRFGSGATTGGAGLVYSESAVDRPCFNCGQMMRKTANFCSHCRAPKESRLAGRYQFAGIVGGGGMGGVLGVEDMNLLDSASGHGRLLVAKFALPNPDPDLAEQSRRERQFLVSIDHPRLVKVIDLITFGGKDWIVMELVAGEDLAVVQKALQQAISVVDALRYTIQVCEAFTYLHTLPSPIIYRDMKPDNVMLMPTGDVKIIDLGGAKVLDRSAKKDDIPIGTQGYYPPEARGGLTDERSDIYTLGRTLLALVLGDAWRAADEPYGVPDRELYPALRKYRMLYDLIARACAIKPEERYSSAAELSEDLRAVLRSIAGASAGVVTVQRFGATTLAGKPVSTPVSAVPDSEPASAELQAGDIFLQVGRADRALLIYEKAVRSYPNSVDALCRLAVAHAALGEHAIATSTAMKAATLAPANWRPRWAAAQILLHSGEMDGAVQQLRLVVKSLPGEAPPLLALAAALQETNGLDEAIETYGLLLEADPQNGEALYELGLACRKAGDDAGALDALGKVPPSDGRYNAARVAYLETALAAGDPKVLADDAAQIASSLHKDAADLPEVQEVWARYCFAAARLDRDGQLPNGAVKVDGASLGGGQLLRTGDHALRDAIRKTPPGSVERSRLVSLWQERPWTAV
jgi:serine/threonine-protein kinase PknG